MCHDCRGGCRGLRLRTALLSSSTRDFSFLARATTPSANRPVAVRSWRRHTQRLRPRPWRSRRRSSSRRSDRRCNKRRPWARSRRTFRRPAPLGRSRSSSHQELRRREGKPDTLSTIDGTRKRERVLLGGLVNPEQSHFLGASAKRNDRSLSAELRIALRVYEQNESRRDEQ